MSEVPQQANFFNTQVPFNKRKRHSADHLSFNAALRLKQIKQQAKKLQRVYTRALSQKTQREKSINQLHKNAQKVRVDFLKLYENKKIKLLNKQKVQNFLVQSKQHLNSVHRKTRQRKLIDQYQMLTTKNQQHENNQARQQKNKKDKQKLLKQIKVKNMQLFLFAKQQYSKIKDEKSLVTQRNKKIEEIIQMRSHINYAQKIEKQLAIIGHYQDLLKQIQEDEDMSELVRPATSASKNFFITSRKMHSSKESRGVHTSHTAR